jgi:hypothetical protein
VPGTDHGNREQIASGGISVAYSRTIDRHHPGCIIFLLDQSTSMGQALSDQPDVSKAERVADAINSLLFTIVRRCTKDRGAPPRHYYDLGIIGYGNSIRPLFAGSLAGRRLASVAEIADAASVVERDGIRKPVWFEPVFDGWTPMCGAFVLAGEIAHGWLASHPNSFPPIVINISDGVATTRERHGDICDHPGSCDAEDWAGKLRRLGNGDGNLLLFNIHISSKSPEPTKFPSSHDALNDDQSRRLFRMSSELPPFMRKTAAELGLAVAPGARGLVCNADMSTVVQALEVGTKTDLLEPH